MYSLDGQNWHRDLEASGSALCGQGARLGIAIWVVFVMAFFSLPGWAQESQGEERILHRYFDATERFGVEVRRGGSSASDQGSSDQPGAARSVLRRNEPPGLWLSPGPDEWIWTAEGPIGPSEIAAPHGPLTAGSGESELDDRTDHVDELGYQANFEPSVVPFKRGVAQNRIRRGDGGSYVAYLESQSYRRVEVGGTIAAGEERFWGSFLLRLEPGVRHAVPSVAPHQRVLTVQTEPPVEVTIEADEANNFYVSAGHRGVVRINMELAVDRQYFDGTLDDRRQWRDFEQLSEFDSGELSQRSDEVLATIGIDRSSMTPLEALNRLVEYHRGFDMTRGRDLDGRDRYIEISRQRVGVCRHRSLVFTISARALGIETHYVYNEAHAFVEVRWPGQGWRRIDLGGAADAFEYQNRGSGQIHDGMWDDVFPRPESYEQEVRQMTGADSSDGAGDMEIVDNTDGSSAESPAPEGDGGSRATDAMEMVETSSPEGDDPAPVVEVLDADGQVYRGRPLSVSGRVDSTQPVDRVRIYLVPSGSSTVEGGIELGEANVDESGRFQGEWIVPPRVTLGRWQLRGIAAE